MMPNIDAWVIQRFTYVGHVRARACEVFMEVQSSGWVAKFEGWLHTRMICGIVSSIQHAFRSMPWS